MSCKQRLLQEHDVGNRIEPTCEISAAKTPVENEPRLDFYWNVTAGRLRRTMTRNDGLMNVIINWITQPVPPDDCLAEYCHGCETVATTTTTTTTMAAITPPQMRKMSTASVSKKTGDIVDMEIFLLVSGVYHLQLFQLPVQPRRYPQWTIAPG